MARTGYVATVKVNRVQGSGQYCAQLDSYYNRVFVYGSSPSDALSRLEQHSLMMEIYRPRVVEVARRYRNWQLDDCALMVGVPLTTIVPS